MITEEKTADLIEECVKGLCDDNVNHGAESLVELAQIFAKAGIPKLAFNNMRQHIINTAIERTGDSGFIQMKLEQAEKSLRRGRNAKAGNSNIIIH